MSAANSWKTFLAALLACACAQGAEANQLTNALDEAVGKKQGGGGAPPAGEWVDAWAAAPQGPYPSGCGGPFPAKDLFTLNGALEQSIRMVVKPSVGGIALRLRFSNVYGDRDLTLGHTTLARRPGGGRAIDTGSLRDVTFGGQVKAVLKPGTERLSDPVSISFAAEEDLAVSTHVTGGSGKITWHSDGLMASFVTRTGRGDKTAEASGGSFTDLTTSYFFLVGAQAFDPAESSSLVAIGDSITDGAGSTPGGADRWLDVLGDRLRAAGKPLGTINAGISCNAVTYTSASGGLGGEARFTRDVLARTRVSDVFVFEGTNDIASGGVTSAQALTGALARMATAARQHGARVTGATLIPRPADGDPAHESLRREINTWIRSTTVFDTIVDFDAVVRDPMDPSRIAEPFDRDGIHPNSAGHAAMGRAAAVALGS